MNKRLKIRLNFHICKSSTLCEGITIFCIKIFSLSVNEVIFSLSLSRSFSIVSVLQKRATKPCCLERRGRGETDKKRLSEVTPHPSAPHCGPDPQGPTDIREADKQTDGVPTGNHQGPLHRWGTGGLDLLTTLVTCHTGIAGTKFWVQGPGSAPLAPSSSPPACCRIHLFI